MSEPSDCLSRDAPAAPTTPPNASADTATAGIAELVSGALSPEPSLPGSCCDPSVDESEPVALVFPDEDVPFDFDELPESSVSLASESELSLLDLLFDDFDDELLLSLLLLLDNPDLLLLELDDPDELFDFEELGELDFFDELGELDVAAWSESSGSLASSALSASASAEDDSEVLADEDDEAPLDFVDLDDFPAVLAEDAVSEEFVVSVVLPDSAVASPASTPADSLSSSELASWQFSTALCSALPLLSESSTSMSPSKLSPAKYRRNAEPASVEAMSAPSSF